MDEANEEKKKAGVAILVSDKTDFKPTKIKHNNINVGCKWPKHLNQKTNWQTGKEVKTHQCAVFSREIHCESDGLSFVGDSTSHVRPISHAKTHKGSK